MKLAAILIPLLVAFIVLAVPLQMRASSRLAMLAALPALYVAFIPGTLQSFDMLLLGVRLELQLIDRAVLGLAASCWLLAGWMAGDRIRHHQSSFIGFWLISFAGVVMLSCAGDIVSFYFGYAMASLAAWGLVMHDRNADAQRASRIYLIVTLLGEGLVLAGVLLLAGVFGNATLSELGSLMAADRVHPSVFWLLVTGFGIKVGMLPLHFWLPLAHPVAPAQASAVLSGVIVKTGLLGWINLLPAPGNDAHGLPPLALLVAGLITAFSGVLLGLTQRKLKTILAYSTVSQMGLMIVAFAFVLASDQARVDVLPVIALFVFHHGFIKAALFTAADCSPGASKMRLALLGVCGLALAAAPLTGGFLVKELVKQAVGDIGWMVWLLSLTSAATALLMLHMLRCAREQTRNTADTVQPIHPAWPVLTVLGLAIPWFWIGNQELEVEFSLATLWAATWPLLVAAAIAFSFARIRLPKLPAGDIVVWLEQVFARSLPFSHRKSTTMPKSAHGELFAGRFEFVEHLIRNSMLAGLLVLAVALSIWTLLQFG